MNPNAELNSAEVTAPSFQAKDIAAPLFSAAWFDERAVRPSCSFPPSNPARVASLVSMLFVVIGVVLSAFLVFAFGHIAGA